jgi:catechol 2,3-dioxygenase-like lactoylglutathione lyase family enzyme
MKVNQLNHTALHVADIARSIDFYKTVCGLTQIPRPDFDFEGAWFELGPGQELHLIGGRDAEVSSASRGTHFAMHVDNIAAALDHLQSLNIEVNGPKERPDGAIQLFITDPDGHVLEFTNLDTADASLRRI